MIRDSAQRTLLFAFLFITALYVAWIGAWLIELTRRYQGIWMHTWGGQTLCWTLAKASPWVCPAVMRICLSGRETKCVSGIGCIKATRTWGGIGLLLDIPPLAQKTIGRPTLFSSSFGWGFLGGVIISPVVEEVTFRGTVLGNLLQRYKFFTANTLTAIFFIGVHLEGGMFKDAFVKCLVSPFGALSRFQLGWECGFVAHRN